MRTTAMCWGFDVGNGWYELLKEAAIQLEPLCRVEYHRYAYLEKKWYKHVRTILHKAAKIPPLFKVLYWLSNKLIPNLSNPFYWYGGCPRASQIKLNRSFFLLFPTSGTTSINPIFTTQFARLAT